MLNERRLAYEGAVARFVKDKAHGKIGAEAEQEAAKAKAKEKKPKGKKVAVTLRVQGKSKGRKEGRKNPRNKEIPPPPADTAPIASPAP